MKVLCTKSKLFWGVIPVVFRITCPKVNNSEFFPQKYIYGFSYHFQKTVTSINSNKHFSFCVNHSEFPLAFALNLGINHSARFYNSEINYKLFYICPFRSSLLKIWIPTGWSFMEFHFWNFFYKLSQYISVVKIRQNH